MENERIKQMEYLIEELILIVGKTNQRIMNLSIEIDALKRFQ